MPRRVVIHAGFHKTGTSTVQQVLRANRPQLKPHLRSLLKGQMQDTISAARGFSTWRDPLSLTKFGNRLTTALTTIPPMPNRVLCLSAEELSGHLPGRGDLRDYSAAAPLAVEMARVVIAEFPGTELVFFYSTRHPDAWLRSAYWEHVRSSSLTMGWDDYAETYAASADLDSAVDSVAAALPCAVHRARLEDSALRPGGPAAPLLDLCDVPPAELAALTLPPPVNERRDPAILLALLAANRDYTDRDTRTAAKQAILRAAQENTRD